MKELLNTPYLAPNSFWAIKGERGGFFYRNHPDLPKAIYTKRVKKRWATNDGCVMARNNVEGWNTEMFRPVLMLETFVKEYPIDTLPDSNIPDENSLVCFDADKRRYYKKGKGFTAKSINTATHFASFKKVKEVVGDIGTAKVIELHSAEVTK